MKHNFTPMVGVAAVALALSGSVAFAEDYKQTQGQQGQQGQMSQSPGAGGMSGQQRMTVQKSVDDITGKSVVNRTGEKIGDVDKVVRSKQDSQPYAVISVGGVLGLGDKDIAVPLKRLSMKDDQVILPEDLNSKSAMQNEPSWESTEYNEIAGSEQVEIERAEFAAFESEGRGQSGAMQGSDPGATGQQPRGM